MLIRPLQPDRRTPFYSSIDFVSLDVKTEFCLNLALIEVILRNFFEYFEKLNGSVFFKLVFYM